ncbi:cell wall metabolism sensor histidine kinase WalK [Paenibacillus psychroresistens]|uniref:histidine kinase n=1 Tax=Paenibacillus psychroresistens TaxID=1778678 RepID=A0A6B8RTJ8_9BACL|nr:cell wall metabolism sensor histidine kinase WalK [Paenibacillus psychroresistens]QGQ99840.1 cell wall metabolism sensor histidine kinase WalK [Paenibacillus psychroresistens]
MKGIRFLRTIQVKLIIMYVLLILFAMQLIGLYFMRTMESSFRDNFSNTLDQQAQLFAQSMASYLTPTNQDGKIVDDQTVEAKKRNADLSTDIGNWNKVINADIQVIDANGIVLASSQSNAENIVGQKNTLPIVSRALQNITESDNDGILIDVDGKRKKFIARPIGSGGKVIGVVYIVASMEDTFTTIQRIKQIFWSGTIIALAMTALLGVILSHTITSPIKEITKQVTYIAAGSFDHQLQVRGQDEIGQLSHAFNGMTERLKEALSLNEEERDKLASILSNMSDGVIATDTEGRVIVINQVAKQMLQLDDQIEGTPLAQILRISPEMALPRQIGQTNTNLIDVSFPNGEDLTVRVTFTPIQRREMGVTGTIVVLQDVTEQEQLEQARREFVANVSHELRTPLTTIKSYLEALEGGALEEPQLAQRFVGVTRNETERMIRLVTDLLHLSRLDSKEAMLAKEWITVSDMLEEVADRFAFQLLQRNTEIFIVVEQELPTILIDRDKIDQVLDNLVSNAIKYTGDSGRIELGARKNAQNELEIFVQDNGIGIPQKDLSRIFERFYRVDKARSRNMGGTGLGLSIAQEIIRAHGGDILLESEYNIGTRVTFTIPYLAGESEEI